MRSGPQWKWYLDEAFVTINGVQHYLWRAVDHERRVLESVVTKTRDRKAALKLLRKRCAASATRANRERSAALLRGRSTGTRYRRPAALGATSEH